MTENSIRLAVLRFARSQPWGRSVRNLAAHRETGSPRLGGIWQCYEPAGQCQQSSIGPNIHAASDGTCEAR